MTDIANTIKYYVYEILRHCIASSSRAYFRHIAILHQERVPTEGPVFLICNHPNALTDPIIAACYSERQVYFLTRGDIFKKPLVDWIFRSLKMLPVYRQKDGGNTVERNAPTFSQTADILQHGGCAIIFPEATMDKKRSLRPFKTGTARIALDVQARFGLEERLPIVPVSVTYRRPYEVGHDFVLQYGEPIYCEDLLPEYNQNQEEAHLKLTQRLEETMRKMVLHMPNDEAYPAREACYEFLVRAALPDPKDEHELAQRWEKEKAFCDKLATTLHDEDATNLAGAVEDWLARGEAMGVPREAAYEEPPSKERLWLKGALLGLTAPLAGFCWLQNAAAHKVRDYFIRKVNSRDFDPSVTFFCACLVSPATYLVQSALVSLVFGPLIGVTYLALCPVSFRIWFTHKVETKKWKLSRALHEATTKGGEAFSSWRSELRGLVQRVLDLSNQ
jgi:glycerol-3-phosphate O-acyltransferase/dihydroxyacetone phosphate acyltransferase